MTALQTRGSDIFVDCDIIFAALMSMTVTFLMRVAVTTSITVTKRS